MVQVHLTWSFCPSFWSKHLQDDAACVHLSLNQTRDSQMDWGLDLDWTSPGHLTGSVEVFLQSPQSQICRRFKQVSLKNFFCVLLCPAWWTSLQHEAAPTVLHCGEGVLSLMRAAGWFSLSLIWSFSRLCLWSSALSRLMWSYEQMITSWGLVAPLLAGWQ